jgi:hypothetical protein
MSNRLRKRFGISTGILITVLFLCPIIVPVFVPWNEINCRHEYINIKTGQAKYTRYLWYCKISESVEDTPLSEALGGEIVDIADVAAWRVVNAFSPGVNHSPHYRFHGALAQASNVGLYFENSHPSLEKKRQIARQVLTLWQKRGDYFGADDVIRSLDRGGADQIESEK